MTEPVKIELGGGSKPKGEGFINIDKSEHADIHYDLSGIPWPLENESVDEVYSSHCLEHIENPMAILYELVRVCKLGANILIKVPMVASDLAMVWDHKHVFSPIAAINADVYFPKDMWKAKHRLKLVNIKYEPSILLQECKRELPFIQHLSDEVIMRWFPRTCHECCFHYTVIVNEFYTPTKQPTLFE